MGYLISETTKEKREQIVREALGNIDGQCDGCMSAVSSPLSAINRMCGRSVSEYLWEKE